MKQAQVVVLLNHPVTVKSRRDVFRDAPEMFFVMRLTGSTRVFLSSASFGFYLIFIAILSRSFLYL